MDIEKIAIEVEIEWGMGFAGVEWDFAIEVANRAVAAEREACANDCAAAIMARSSEKVSGATRCD